MAEVKPPEPDDPDEALRGFEIVRWDRRFRAWVMVGRFRPTELAIRQATADMKWLQERHPEELYEMRALVAVRRGTHTLPPSEQPQVTTDEAPLKLDADYEPAEVNAGSESE